MYDKTESNMQVFIYLCTDLKAMEQEGKYNSVVMARLIAAYAIDNGFSINMTKIQKLLYVAYGVSLAVKGERLVNEHPQAWPYGPVFPTTRNKLLKENIHAISLKEECFSEMRKDKDTMELLELVFRSFGNWSAAGLTGWSHKPDSPWEHTISVKGFKWGDRMDDNDIKNYFNSIIDERK